MRVLQDIDLQISDTLSGMKRDMVMLDVWCNVYLCHVTSLSITECSQPAAQTANQSFLMAYHVKAFITRRISSGSTQPKAAHLEGGLAYLLIKYLARGFNMLDQSGTDPLPRLQSLYLKRLSSEVYPSINSGR